MWLADAGKPPRLLNNLISVGELLSYLPLTGQAPPPPPPPEAAFDRGKALTGIGALARLAAMTVAVVGASGTGSLLCELLARAGCRRIILIDDDICKDVNLNRILYVTADDVTHKRSKVDVIKRGIENLGLGCRVEAVFANASDKVVLARLKEADLIFGCVDRALPRQLLCEFAIQYLRPYIDVGSEIGGDEKGIVSLNARVNYIAPGRPCLSCTGLVTPRQLGFESKAFHERERVVQLGYSDDLVMDQPAVMDLNMRAASIGMMLLRHLLQPFLLTPLPITISENVVTYTSLAIQHAKALNDQCRVCQCNPSFGWGDRGPQVGLEELAVAAITGRHSQK